MIHLCICKLEDVWLFGGMSFCIPQKRLNTNHLQETRSVLWKQPGWYKDGYFSVDLSISHWSTGQSLLPGSTDPQSTWPYYQRETVD